MQAMIVAPVAVMIEFRIAVCSDVSPAALIHQSSENPGIVQAEMRAELNEFATTSSSGT